MIGEIIDSFRKIGIFHKMAVDFFYKMGCNFIFKMESPIDHDYMESAVIAV